MQVKKSTAFRAPVLLLDTDGSPLTGKAYSDVTVWLQPQGGASSQKTLSSGTQFVEVDSTNMPGYYDLLLTTSDTATIGGLKYSVLVGGVPNFVDVLEIVEYLTSDVKSDTSSILSALANIATDARISRKVATGRWKIDSTANTFTVYDDNNTSALYTFDLTDSGQQPTATAIFERYPR